MAAINSSASCYDCLFWRRGDLMGLCRRYPESFNKHQNDWCGEYSKIVVNVEPYPEVMKKRGRPAKADHIPTIIGGSGD